MYMNNKDNEKIKIYNADFRDITKDLPDDSIDLILTDPPYLTNFKCQINFKYRLSTHKHERIYKDSFKSKEGRDLINDFFCECKRLLKKDGLLLFFINDKRLLYFMQMAFNNGLWQNYFITWVKNNIHMNQYHTQVNKRAEYILGYRKERLEKISYNPNMELYDVINFDNIDGSLKNHPNEKPQNILLHFLQLFNYKNDKIFKVLDPFMGGVHLVRLAKLLTM